MEDAGRIRQLQEQQVNDYYDMVQQIASEYRNKYQMVERSDIEQELWLWFAEHPNNIARWKSEQDEKSCDKLIAKSLRNAALDYCVKEKAVAEGYNATDNFFILELRIVQVRKSYYLFTGVQPVCHSRVIIIDKQKTVRELKMDIFKFFRPLITLPAGRTKYTDEE